MSAQESLTEVFGESGCGDNSERYARELLAEHRDEVLREWAVKVREVGTAKGWSTWAAAFMDPDVEFVDTGMPSTETIVAELRRLDRAAVLRDVAEQQTRIADVDVHNSRSVLATVRRVIAGELRSQADEIDKGGT